MEDRQEVARQMVPVFLAMWKDTGLEKARGLLGTATSLLWLGKETFQGAAKCDAGEGIWE